MNFSAPREGSAQLVYPSGEKASWLRGLGYPPEVEQVNGLAEFRNFLPVQDMSRLAGLLDAWRHLRDDEVRTDEYRIHAADGVLRWLLGRETVFARQADGRVHQILSSSQQPAAVFRSD